jgi:hypothetical protein
MGSGPRKKLDDISFRALRVRFARAAGEQALRGLQKVKNPASIMLVRSDRGLAMD